MSSREEVDRIKEKYKGYLLGSEGVTGVGGNGSIKIYVDPKITPRALSALPSKLDGVPVIIVKGKARILGIASVPVAASIYGYRVTRVRPVPGGVSIGRKEATGTLMCKGIDVKTGEPVGITNNHVAALHWGERQDGNIGDKIAQPGCADGGSVVEDAIGELDGWIPVELNKSNLVDCARFKSPLLSELVEEVGRPLEVVEPAEGRRIVVSSRTGLKFSSIIDVNASLMVEGWGDCLFENCVVAQPGVLVPGDSGSWAGDADTYRSTALGFAGSEDISVFCRASLVEDGLGVKLIPPVSESTLNNYKAYLGIAATLLTAGGLLYSSLGKRKRGEGIAV